MRLAMKEAGGFGADVDALFAFAAEHGCLAVQIHLPDDEHLAAIKAAMRANGQRPTGMDLVGQLHSYSEIGKAYIQRITATIRSNDMAGFDTVTVAQN